MCGAGTIIAEQLIASGRFHAPIEVCGGDIEFAAARSAAINLRRLGEARLCRWDARRLPLPPGVADHVVSNPPFGKQLSSPAEVRLLYRDMVREYDRILRPGGQAVLLVSDGPALRESAREVGWKPVRRVKLRVLGQAAQISAWRKPVG
jgi:tRNA G10  N-methylase Trm11